MKAIKWNKLVVIVLCLGFFLVGCKAVQNSNKSQRGAVIGGAAGAGVGAIIGGKNPALAIILGTAIGGGAGAIIGHQMDKQAQEIKQVMPGATVTRSEEGIQVILDETSEVNFDYGKYDLTTSSEANLDKLVGIFEKYDSTKIYIFGFTDSMGSDQFNQTLSEKRAQTVANYLVSQGLNSNRMETKGYGKSNPIASNSTEEGRARNRRVEFAITADQALIQKAKEDEAKDEEAQGN